MKIIFSPRDHEIQRPFIQKSDLFIPFSDFNVPRAPGVETVFSKGGDSRRIISEKSLQPWPLIRTL